MPPATSQVSLTATLSSLNKQWQGLQPGQRRTIVGGAVAVLLSLLVWAGLAVRGPTMAPLFTNLSPQAGAAILTQLQHTHTPYRLTNGGQTILVPAAQVDALRLQLAGQGLPNQGNVGLGSVLNLPFGATNFTRQVAYQNALQGELASTIDAVQGVRSARVAIVMPAAPVFGGGGTPASAAVLVNLQPGATLAPAQVAGIEHLVASSVQGLSPSGVTVLDQTGQILSAITPGSTTTSGPAVSGTAAQAQNNLLVQHQFDQQLQQRLEGLLAQVFGPGNVVAQVQSQFNFNSGTVDRTVFLPGKSRAVLASMKELKQTMTGQGATALTPAGTAANSYPPTYKTAPQNSKSSSLQLSQNFDISRQVTHTIVAPGTLSRLSVSVIVNGALTPAQQRLVQSAVAAAVGYNPARHDQISVVGLPFNQSLLTALQKQPAPTAAVPVWARVPVLLGAIGLLLLLLLLALLRRRGREPEPAGPPALPAPAEVEARVGAGQDALSEALLAATTARRRAEEALRERPEEVARVVRAWLTDDE